MAVPVKTVSEETPSPFAVNKPLFEEATAIKDKLRLIEGRLQKMEEHRNEVSDSVYLKVKTDYEVQMDEVRDQFSEKSREIEAELRNLYSAQAEQENSLSGHQEILEEAKFRHKLGEFNDKKFKDLETQQNKDIKKYNDLLDIIKGSIKQYEGILGHPFEAGKEPEKPRPVKSAPSAPPPPPPPAVAKAPEPKIPEPKVSEEIPQDTADFEIDDIPEAVAPPPPPPAPVAKAPAPDTGDTDIGFEDKLSDELDMILEGESDYFGEAAPAAKAPEPAKTPKAEKVSPKQALSRTEPVEDSISTILRDIPMEDEGSEPAVTRVAAEETGANIDIRETPAEASMLLIEGDLDESEFILAENTSIGRSPSNDIVLKESKVSRQHAAINYIGGNYVLVDLKSSNGVFVNGKKIEEAALRDGDEVSVGSFKFQFNLA
jgi:pSer/pThr/pTyr-binding forkhead associated (FHA) protein